MVTLYVDDTADFGGEGFFALGAFAASAERWSAFHEDWNRLLNANKLPYLHTSDYLSARKGYPSFDDVPYEARLVVLRDFASVIRKYVYSGFAIGVDGAAYRKSLSGGKSVSPDVFCFERLLSHLHGLMQKLGVNNDHVEVVFDDSEASASRLLSSWRILKKHKRVEPHLLTAITFADDRFVLPLQAADMLACGLSRGIKQKEVWNDPGNPFMAIFEVTEGDPSGPGFVQEYWDTKAIEQRTDELRRVAARANPGGG